VDIGAIDLEVFDGNADNVPSGPPKPAAKGGIAGVALDRALRDQINAKKQYQVPQRKQADIESDDEIPPQVNNQRSQ